MIQKLERKLDRFAIPHISTVVAVTMGIVWLLSLVRPDILPTMAFDWELIRRGQVWRAVSYLFIPPSSSPLFMIFALYMVAWTGESIEQRIGAFRFNLFYLIGMIGTTTVGILTGAPQTSSWIASSVFFAFATLFPNMQLLIMFILPVAVKWLAMLAAAGVVWMFIGAESGAERFAILAAFANYFLFFGKDLWLAIRGRSLAVRARARQEAPSKKSIPPTVDGVALGQRVCAICGKKEADGADIRVCSCEKCGNKPRSLCLEHARAH